MIHDDDVKNVLQKDGVDLIDLHSYENNTCTSIEEVKEKFGDASWATRIAYNERFGGVLIRQFPGSGNRMHYHPDWDEWWYIVEGEWEWNIEGKPKKVVKGDVVFINRNRKHKRDKHTNRFVDVA